MADKLTAVHTDHTRRDAEILSGGILALRLLANKLDGFTSEEEKWLTQTRCWLADAEVALGEFIRIRKASYGK